MEAAGGFVDEGGIALGVGGAQMEQRGQLGTEPDLETLALLFRDTCRAVAHVFQGGVLEDVGHEHVRFIALREVAAVGEGLLVLGIFEVITEERFGLLCGLAPPPLSLVVLLLDRAGPSVFCFLPRRQLGDELVQHCPVQAVREGVLDQGGAIAGPEFMPEQGSFALGVDAEVKPSGQFLVILLAHVEVGGIAFPDTGTREERVHLCARPARHPDDVAEVEIKITVEELEAGQGEIDAGLGLA
jgi:hypothetical protein